MSPPSHLQIIPLGGLGEFGMNLMVYRWGDDCVVVDAGMMFPGVQHLGVEVVIPDLSFLDDCGTIHGVVLTHGHEDHIGALSYLLARRDVPVYSTPYTAGLVRNRLSENGMLEGRRIDRLPDRGAALPLGPFIVESVAVAHSIPQSRMLVLHTPVGLVVHTSDFKLDPDPVDGAGTDVEELARLGRAGVLALMSDSTNAAVPGFTRGERSVGAAIDRLITGRDGRVVVSIVSSHIHRLQQLVDLAVRHRRKLAILGSALTAHVQVASDLGLLRLPSHLRIAPDRIGALAPRETLIVAAGTQGEPLSALARIAVGQHREVELADGDLVIHSARKLPGNEKSIDQMINHLLRRGAEVITADDAPVHVSGHAAQDELRLLLQILRPKVLVPIHGEYRQLLAHARLAVDLGMDRRSVQLADSGDVIALDGTGVSVVDRVHVGQVFIDAALDEIDHSILRDRRKIADEGIVVPVVAVRRESGALDGYSEIEIMTRGFVVSGADGGGASLSEARKVVAASIAAATPEERTDEGLLRARIQTELKRFFRRQTQRRPLVIPIIVEL